MEFAKGALVKFAYCMRLTTGDHIVVGLWLLEHQTHSSDIIRGMTPVAPGLQVPQAQLAGQAQLDPHSRIGNLSGYELESTSRSFVVEKQSADAEQVISLAVVSG